MFKFFWRTPCETCAVLKEQLEYERKVNAELTETLTALLKPQPIQIQQVQQPSAIKGRAGTWTHRRSALERADREEARIKNTSPYVAKPDSELKPETTTAPPTVAQLEMELGIAEDVQTEEIH